MAQGESLGKSILDLEANLGEFKRNMAEGRKVAGGMKDTLNAVATIANIAERELNRVKMGPGQAAESRASASGIISGVRGIGDEARTAARELDNVKITQAQAAESKLAANEITNSLQKVERQALRTRAATGGNPGVGVGPFGSGFGRVGVLGAAVGAGTLLGPAAAPAMVGLLATLPSLAAGATGAIGTLALAFQGVGKAIEGDKKAFDALVPAQKEFVLQIRSMHDWLQQLKQTAASNLFPGLTDALHSALSPGTVAAVTKAITDFAQAIGNAGRQWGTYFGSAEFQSIFGPLMQSGARNLGVMSDAALHLFDAIGVLGRAGIPFTNWMTDGIAKGAQLASSWMHAQEASGALAHGMDEAKVSLQLVGKLFESLLNAAGALGTALYPVSKIAVKDLTDGLNSLAWMIDRNRDGIRDFAGGALKAIVGVIKDLSALIRDLSPTLKTMFDRVDALVTPFGGWKTILEGMVALKFAAVVGGWAGAIQKFAAGEALGAAEAGSGGLLANLRNLKALGPIAIGVTVGLTAKWLSETDIGKKLGLDYSGKDLFKDIAGLVGGGGSGSSTAFNPGASATMFGGAAGASFYGKSVAGVNPTLLNRVSMAAAAVGATSIQVTSAKRAPGPGNDVSNSNHITGNALDGYAIIGGRQVPIGTALKAVAAQYGLRSGDVAGFDPKTPGGFDPIHVDDGANVNGGSPLGGPQPAWTKNLGAAAKSTHPNLNLPHDVSGSFLSPFLPGTKYGGPAPSGSFHYPVTQGAALLPPALRARMNETLQQFAATSDMSAVLTGQAASAAAGALRENLGKQASILKAETLSLKDRLDQTWGAQKVAVQQEMAKVAGQLKNVQGQIVGSLQANVQTLQSHVGTLFQSVTGQLDAAFEAKTQSLADQLGVKFFQGTQTPLEQQLAGMQSADTLKQLQDTLTAATTDQERAAAQRALDEYELSIRASEERTQADRDYARELKQLQTERSAAEADMNRKLAALSEQLLNGTGSMSNLTSIADQFGVVIAEGTVPDFANLSTATTDLQTAFGQLRDYVDRITGNAGGSGSSSDLISENGNATAAVAAVAAIVNNHLAGGGYGVHGAPQLHARGGILNRRTWIGPQDIGGEAGPEALIPLNDPRALTMVARAAGSGGGFTLQTGPIYGTIDRQIARDWAATLKAELDRAIEV